MAAAVAFTLVGWKPFIQHRMSSHGPRRFWPARSTRCRMTDRERHPQPLPLLTWLAVKGLASDDDIARRLGADPAISSLLRQLVTDGVVEHQAGFFVLT